MIIIGIKNFRTYVGDEYTVVDFERGMNLLSGISGRGKTTIFHAIQWALFKRPISGNGPLYSHQKSPVTSVFVDLRGEMKITRSAPGGLTVHDYVSGRIVEDQEAQILIEERFGKEHVWRSCNYIMQGTINPIISRDLTDSQRWDVLHSLAIPDQANLELFKSRIKEEFRKMEDDRLRLETELHMHQQNLQDLASRKTIIEEELREYPETKFQMGILTRLTKTYPNHPRRDTTEATREMNALNMEFESISGEVSRLAREHSASTNHLKAMSLEKDNLTATLKRLHKEIREEERRIDLERKLDREIPELASHQDKIQRAQKLFSKIGWFNSFGGGELVDVMGDHQTLQTWKNLNHAHEKFHRREEIDKILKTKFRDHLRDLAPGECWSEMISFGRTEDGALFGTTCPGCARGIRVFKNRLEIEKCNIHLSDREHKMLIERDSLRTIAPDGAPRTDSEIGLLERKLVFDEQWMRLPEGLRILIVKYSSIKIFELPDEDQVVRDIQESIRRVDEIKGEVEDIEEKYRIGKMLIEEQNREKMNLSNRLSDNEEKLRSLKVRVREYEHINRWWDDLEEMGFKSFDDLNRAWEISTRRQMLGAKLVDIEHHISSAKEKMNAITSNNLSDISLRCDALNRLRDLSESAESEILKRCMYHLESSTNEFLENAFDHPISLHLGTEKESKTTSRKKHTLTVSVETCREDQQTAVRRTIDGFSGGETDRISLGFSMALTSLSKFPMIILDECISSLDTELRDKVIRALRSQAKATNKTVVLVCHDALEGLFDNVINV